MSKMHALYCNSSALGESSRRGLGAPMENREITAACCMMIRPVSIGMPRSPRLDFEDLYISVLRFPSPLMTSFEYVRVGMEDRSRHVMRHTYLLGAGADEESCMAQQSTSCPERAEAT